MKKAKRTAQQNREMPDEEAPGGTESQDAEDTFLGFSMPSGDGKPSVEGTENPMPTSVPANTASCDKPADKMNSTLDSADKVDTVIAFRWNPHSSGRLELVAESVGQIGYTPASLCSSDNGLAILTHADDLPRLLRLVGRCHADGVQHVELEHRIVAAEGRVRWVDHYARLATDPESEQTYCLSVLSEIKDGGIRGPVGESCVVKLDLRVQPTLRACIECDTDSRVIHWDPPAEKMFSFSREEALGRRLFQLVPAADTLGTLVEDIGYSKDPLSRSHQVCRHVTRDGQILYCEWHNMPMVGADGQKRRLVSLIRDVTRQRMAEEALRQAVHAADVANRAKTTFLAGMSHELRTPLNAIIGFSNVLLENYYGPLNERQREYVGEILDSGKHLLTIIDKLLELAKIDAGSAGVHYAETGLEDLLNQGLATVKEMTSSRRQQLLLRLDEDLAGSSIIADETNLKRVIANLLSNASELSPMEGTIVLEARKTAQGELEVWISDIQGETSIEQRDVLFDSSDNSKAGSWENWSSADLGFMLARRLIELHGGKIRFSRLTNGVALAFRVPVGGPAMVQGWVQEIIMEANSTGEKFAICCFSLNADPWEEKAESALMRLDETFRREKRAGDALIARRRSLFIVLRHISVDGGASAWARLKKLCSAFEDEVDISYAMVTYPIDGTTATSLFKGLSEMIGRSDESGLSKMRSVDERQPHTSDPGRR